VEDSGPLLTTEIFDDIGQVRRVKMGQLFLGTLRWRRSDPERSWTYFQEMN